MKLRAPRAIADRTLAAKERISAVAEKSPEGMSKDKIVTTAGGNKRDNLNAIDELLRDGYFANKGTDSRSRIVSVQPWRAPF